MVGPLPVDLFSCPTSRLLALRSSHILVFGLLSISHDLSYIYDISLSGPRWFLLFLLGPVFSVPLSLLFSTIPPPSRCKDLCSLVRHGSSSFQKMPPFFFLLFYALSPQFTRDGPFTDAPPRNWARSQLPPDLIF